MNYYMTFILKSENVLKSGNEILTPKECSNPVVELYINFEKVKIRQEHKEHFLHSLLHIIA